MADAYEHTQNLPGMITALEGLTTLEPLNLNAKIDLAYALVLQGEYGKANPRLKKSTRRRLNIMGIIPSASERSRKGIITRRWPWNTTKRP